MIIKPIWKKLYSNSNIYLSLWAESSFQSWKFRATVTMSFLYLLPSVAESLIWQAVPHPGHRNSTLQQLALAANCSFKSYLLSTIVKKKVKMQLQISIQPIQLQKTTVTVLENCSNSRLVLWYIESTYLCRLLGLQWLCRSQLTSEVLQFKLLYQYCQPSW